MPVDPHPTLAGGGGAGFLLKIVQKRMRRVVSEFFEGFLRLVGVLVGDLRRFLVQ